MTAYFFLSFLKLFLPLAGETFDVAQMGRSSFSSIPANHMLRWKIMVVITN